MNNFVVIKGDEKCNGFTTGGSVPKWIEKIDRTILAKAKNDGIALKFKKGKKSQWHENVDGWELSKKNNGIKKGRIRKTGRKLG